MLSIKYQKMQQTEILLNKRQGKFILYLFTALFCGFVTIGSIINLISSGFDWFVAIAGGVTLICLAIVINGLVQYLTHGTVWLVVESDGQTIRFFNKNQSGKIFNKSEDIALSPIKSFYIIKKSTRYFAKNYAFGYDKGGVLNSEEISVFPSLFDATQAGMHTVLQFVKTARPEIELGYENFFQKLAKR